jgi:hypothetical protein
VWGWVYATVGGRKKVVVGICEFCKVEWFEFDERHCCDEALADKPTVLLDMKACSECGANFMFAKITVDAGFVLLIPMFLMCVPYFFGKR